MENNFENKARFFAQYYGQNVKKSFLPEQTSLQVIDRDVFWIGHLIINGYLELKSLEYITDEDAKAISEIEKDSSTEDPVVRGKALIRDFEYTSLDPLKVIQVVDYLRSKGYALPWMGLSIEKLVEYGWVKLKEKNDGK